MGHRVDHIQGQTYHGRKGAISNAFRYSVDYVLLDAEADLKTPKLFKRNGGKALPGWMTAIMVARPAKAQARNGCRDVLASRQINTVAKIELLAQPNVMGYTFNPVSFWLCRDDAGGLVAVIAEVTNTFGDRHSYLCTHSDLRPICPDDRLMAQKIMHVSPFQPVEGGYEFRFDISDKAHWYLD